jgi:hypothetical protein
MDEPNTSDWTNIIKLFFDLMLTQKLGVTTVVSEFFKPAFWCDTVWYVMLMGWYQICTAAGNHKYELDYQGASQWFHDTSWYLHNTLAYCSEAPEMLVGSLHLQANFTLKLKFLQVSNL